MLHGRLAMIGLAAAFAMELHSGLLFARRANAVTLIARTFDNVNL